MFEKIIFEWFQMISNPLTWFDFVHVVFDEIISALRLQTIWITSCEPKNGQIYLRHLYPNDFLPRSAGPRILGGNLGNRGGPQCVVFWTYVDSKSS